MATENTNDDFTEIPSSTPCEDPRPISQYLLLFVALQKDDIQLERIDNLLTN